MFLITSSPDFTKEFCVNSTRILRKFSRVRHFRPVLTLSLRCSYVIYDSFRWYFKGVKYRDYDRKVTHLQPQGTSVTTRKYRIFHKPWQNYHVFFENQSCLRNLTYISPQPSSFFPLPSNILHQTSSLFPQPSGIFFTPIAKIVVRISYICSKNQRLWMNQR